MKRFKNILYLADATTAQESALVRALSLARSNQARLTVFDAVPVLAGGVDLPPGVPDRGAMQEALIRRRREQLEILLAPHRQAMDIELIVVAGRRFMEAIHTILRNGHDLLVKPAEDPDWLERLFGSDDMHLLRKCPCPVWLLKVSDKPQYERILAAVDIDAEQAEAIDRGINRQILELASSLALSEFAELHLVHAWDAPAEMLLRTWSDNPDAASMVYVESERERHQRAMDMLRQQLRGLVGEEAFAYLSPQIHLVRGSPKQLLPQLVSQLNADLVVMGTLARSGIAGYLIGNTAEAVLDQLQCSVLAVKPEGFRSPVQVPV